MITLTDFLRDRIAEDEAAAWGVAAVAWSTRFSVRFDSWESDHSDGDSAFVDRFDPARVLAECEAKRRIVERAAQLIAEAEASAPYYPSEINDPALVAEADTRDLAAIYADHPDYRESWKP